MTGNITDANIARLGEEISQAEAILIGAGAGLSTAAGFTYSGKRFHQWFFDFEQAYGIRDMYSGGFYPFPSREIYWAWWSRQIYLNRYVDAPLPVYAQLLDLVRDKDYFVLTTNVDHQFQRAGFDKKSCSIPREITASSRRNGRTVKKKLGTTKLWCIGCWKPRVS